MKYCSAENLNGEKGCRTPMEVRRKYQNEPMPYLNMVAFHDYIKRLHPEFPAHTIRNYNKSNSCSYGRYRPVEKEILIYRSCVWTFLHEMAHAVQRYVYKDRGASHSDLFYGILDNMIAEYLYNFTKVIHGTE